MTEHFDLNMDDVLDAWDTPDAIREVIANALDERRLTDSSWEVEISRESDETWKIRDYGRGLEISDLLQDEDEEKLEHPDRVIGKFGVGLKDALATFHQNDVDVEIRSRNCHVELEMRQKSGLEDDINSLHGAIEEPEEDIRGTEVVLRGVTEREIESAKENFLEYSDGEVVEDTKYGQALKKGSGNASIYITGLEVAEEENFLFSYNIDNTTKTLRDAINRERSNVGRTAYASRVKRILKECKSEEIATKLVSDLKAQVDGDGHDELSWKPIQVHACKILNSERENVVFVSPQQLQTQKELIDRAKRTGREIVTIPLKTRITVQKEEDIDGNQMNSVEGFVEEHSDSYEFEWVEEEDLTMEEKEVWGKKEDIFRRVGGRPEIVDEIRISETMRPKSVGSDSWVPKGLWKENESRIILKRECLSSLSKFAGVLIHEATHAKTGFSDVSREFEGALTNQIGNMYSNTLEG